MKFKEAWDKQTKNKRIYCRCIMGTYYLTKKALTDNVRWDCGTQMSFKAVLSDEWSVEDKVKLTTESGEAIYISRESLEELKKL